MLIDSMSIENRFFYINPKKSPNLYNCNVLVPNQHCNFGSELSVLEGVTNCNASFVNQALQYFLVCFQLTLSKLTQKRKKEIKILTRDILKFLRDCS